MEKIAVEACPPLRGAMTSEQIMALQLLLLHFQALEAKDQRIRDVDLYQDNEPLSRHDIRNMLVGRTMLPERTTEGLAKQEKFYSRMHALLLERWPRLAANDTLLDLFRKAYGLFAVPLNPAPAFNMTPDWFRWTGSDRQAILERYAGNYLCLRYAGNNASAFAPDVVVSALSIMATDGDAIPYMITYQPRDPGDAPENIEGRLALVGRFFYLMGMSTTTRVATGQRQDGATGFPHIMAGIHRPGDARARGFQTLLLRQTRDNCLVSARVWALPLRSIDLNRDGALRKVGFVAAADLDAHLGLPKGALNKVKDQILNKGPLDGKGCLDLS